MNRKPYDFAGYVTKNDILCSDGVVIKQNAFASSNGTTVPLVWNHNHNDVNSVLGHVILENKDRGTYGYGYFNDTEEGKNAKELVKHGDINAMSIGARKIKRQGNNVIHGEIFEVSLVLAGANSGATIDTVMVHSDGVDSERGVIIPGTLIHSGDDIPEETLEEEKMNEKTQTKSVEEILDSMTPEQLELVEAILNDEDKHDEDKHDEDKHEEDSVKHNIWDETARGEVLSHSDQESLILDAKTNKVDSFRDYLLHAVDEKSQVGGKDFGIANIEYLFPEVHELDKTPKFHMDQNTNYKKIINGVTKSPFSKIKTRYFDIDIEDEKQRARGYVKGTQKIEEVIKILRRETHPTTIYKKQKLDRDDIIEITDFNVVAALNAEMRILIEIEIARAILIGDGREALADGKIPEDRIRPILTDDPVYSVKMQYKSAEDFIETVIKGKADYEGTGKPTLFIDPILLADVKLLKGKDGRWLNGHIMTDNELAMTTGVGEIVETSFLKNKRIAIMVNLSDYSVGSTKGGQLTTFNDFDIDFNRHKYLIETRLSGALAAPKSAIVFHTDKSASLFKLEKGSTQQGRTVVGDSETDD